LRAWLTAERGRLALWVPVLMGAGVLLYFARHREPAAWTGFAGVVGGVALCAALWRSLEGRVLGLAVLAVASGFLAAQAATWRALPVEALPRKAAVVTARVLAVEALPDGRRATLAEVQVTPDAAPLARSFRLKLDPDDPAPLAAGDRVRVRALLRAPEPPAYPGAWDLQRDSFFAGQGGSARAYGDVVVTEAAHEGGVAQWWQGVRERVGARVRAVLPGATGAVAATLLTGEQAAIPVADRAAFRDSGLAHLLAVAGLHIGIVMGLAFGVARRLLALSQRASLHLPCKALAAGASLAAGGFYVLLTGAHVPTLRSFAMACVVTLGLAVGRRAARCAGWRWPRP
jgi:competence protein ComEC